MKLLKMLLRREKAAKPAPRPETSEAVKAVQKKLMEGVRENCKPRTGA